MTTWNKRQDKIVDMILINWHLTEKESHIITDILWNAKDRTYSECKEMREKQRKVVKKMTLQEVIYQLDRNIDISKNSIGFNAALAEAAKAVEKQIPKKFVTYCRCPNCNNDNLSTGVKYCYNCGQALDWSDKT